MNGKFEDAFWRWISKMDLDKLVNVSFALDSLRRERIKADGRLGGRLKDGDRVTLTLTGTLYNDYGNWAIATDHTGSHWYVSDEDLPVIKKVRK